MSMHICIYEDSGISNLLPIVYLRPVYDLFSGMTSLQEKLIRKFSEASVTLHTRSVLKKVTQDRYPKYLVNEFPTELEEILFINGRALLHSDILLNRLEKNQSFTINNTVVAARLGGDELADTMKTLGSYRTS